MEKRLLTLTDVMRAPAVAPSLIRNLRRGALLEWMHNGLPPVRA